MPGNREAYSTAITTADRLRWDSRWSEAMQEYQIALTQFPEDTTARSGLGFCNMQMKQWQLALQEYEYILQRDSGNIIALSKIAELYGILNKRDNAYQAYSHLADLYAQAGQGARAEAAWQKAVQLSPGNPEPHERLASYYFEKKDISQMLQERLAAAQGYLLRNEPGPARVHCEEVLRADWSNAQAQQLIAHVQAMETGQTNAPESAGAINASVRSDPSAGYPADNQVVSNQSFTGSETSGNTSGGNTGIMGNWVARATMAEAIILFHRRPMGTGRILPLARGLLPTRSQELCSRRKHFKTRAVSMMLLISVSKSWRVASIGQMLDTF